MPLAGGQGPPHVGARPIRGDAVAVVVEAADIELGPYVAGLGQGAPRRGRGPVAAAAVCGNPGGQPLGPAQDREIDLVRNLHRGDRRGRGAVRGGGVGAFLCAGGFGLGDLGGRRGAILGVRLGRRDNQEPGRHHVPLPRRERPPFAGLVRICRDAPFRRRTGRACGTGRWRCRPRRAAAMSRPRSHNREREGRRARC